MAKEKEFDLDDIIRRVESGKEPLADIKAEMDKDVEALGMPDWLLKAHREIHHPDFIKFLYLPAKPEKPN